MKTAVRSSKILVPATGPECWRDGLADPEKHWKVGRSARSMAHSWHASGELPPEIRTVMETVFDGIELLVAIPEWQVPLPGGARPSQNDVWALCRADSGLVSVAVEGKVDETFGPTVGEWSKDASAGKVERMSALCDALELAAQPGDAIRYQLMHRTASAVLEARRFRARHAVMIVQSFSPESRWYEDFAAFTALLGAEASKGTLLSVPRRDDVTLHLAWVQGEERFLRA